MPHRRVFCGWILPKMWAQAQAVPLIMVLQSFRWIWACQSLQTWAQPSDDAGFISFTTQSFQRFGQGLTSRESQSSFDRTSCRAWPRSTEKSPMSALRTPWRAGVAVQTQTFRRIQRVETFNSGCPTLIYAQTPST